MSNKSSPMTIHIPRADYTGDWNEFAADNAAFIPDHELERLEVALRHTGFAIHTAHTAGPFEIEVVKA